jgi:lipopolysaccharide export system permease protein
MKLLERYIFRRVFVLSVVTLSATTLMVLVTQVLLYVNLLTASGQALLTFLALAGTLVPPMTNLVLPFALYIGASQTFNGMNSDSELAVIEASGASLSVQTKPVLVLAIAMAALALLLSHFAEPWAQQHKRQIISKASADLIRFAVQSGTFQELTSNLYVQIAEQLPSGEYAGIFIADSRKPETDLVYYAKRGVIQPTANGDVLALADGEVQRRNTQTGELSVINFQSYVLDFNQFSAATDGKNYSPKERSTAFMLFAPRSDVFFAKNKPEDVRSEVYRRFSDWLYPLVYGTIALYFAVGARSSRQERWLSFSTGVAVALSVRGAGFLLVSISGTDPLWAALNFAIPVDSIVLFSTLLFMNKSLRFSQAWADRVNTLVQAVLNRWNSLRFGGALQSPGGGAGQ